MGFSALPGEVWPPRKIQVTPLDTPEAVIAALRRSTGEVGDLARQIPLGDLDSAFRGHDILHVIDAVLEQPPSSTMADHTHTPYPDTDQQRSEIDEVFDIESDL